MPRFYIGNTDNNWFDFLAKTSPHEEVNFWKPSEQRFRAIDEGELFLFRLKSPRDKIGGYGILASSTTVPIELAWDAFGIGNGVPALRNMVTTIDKYRTRKDTKSRTYVGCRILTNPVFLPEDEWMDVPSDWANAIVSGKVYSTEDSEEAALLYHKVEARIAPSVRFKRDQQNFEGFNDEQQSYGDVERFGSPRLVAPRLGQGSFRLRVADAYNQCCAFSETKVLPALEAAHIRPYAEDGPHAVTNGLFLRKDMHSVFDAGFMTLNDDLSLRVSPLIRERFNNGNEYRRLNGLPLRRPKNEADLPSLDHVRWHRENQYVGD